MQLISKQIFVDRHHRQKIRESITIGYCFL